MNRLSRSRAPRFALLLSALVLALGAAGAGCGGHSSGQDGGVVDGGSDGGHDGGILDGGTDGGTDGGIPDGGIGDGGLGDGGTKVQLKIDQVLPVRGPAAGGTRVTIHGAGFVNGFAKVGDPNIESKTAVLFGSNTAIDFTVIDDDTIQVVSPTGTPGARDVTVQNPNGQITCTGCFLYYTPVAAKSVTPAASPLTGGVSVTLKGAGLIPGTVALVGGREAVSITRVDSKTLTFVAPPGAAPGPVDVVVYNGNGRATLRRSFTYFETPRLAAVDPPVGPAAGGTVVHLTGAGIGGATAVTFGSASATAITADGADALYATTPAGTAGSAVDVTVTTPEGTATAPKAFAYVDPSNPSVSLLAVVPGTGSTAGGGTATLVGTGMGGASPQVRFGATDATGVTPVDANRLQVMVPAAASPGPVTVQVRNTKGGAALTAGYTYLPAISVTSIAPATGDAAGGTQVTIHGAGFASGTVDVRIGALPATAVTVVDDATITCTTPPGSPGPADVVVGTGTGAMRAEATLAGGFTYTAPLTLAQVDPERAAEAGGTRVTLWGTGFTDQTVVHFGTGKATFVSRTGQSQLLVVVPRGNPGLVDVTADDGTQHAVLKQAFQYYNPRNSRGGASGGPMAGTIDVTALDAFAGAPIPGVHVLIGTDPSTPLQGDTDDRGQITFSDPSLVKPVMVTCSRDGYQAVSVARLDARDLTVYMTPNMGHGGTAPPLPPPAFVGGPAVGGVKTPLGRVCGFKLPPSVKLGTNQTAEARVAITSPSLTWLPPFSSGPTYQEVTKDCGTYSLPSRPGQVSVYAMFGVKTSKTDPSTGQTSSTFVPYLMGITRGIEVPGISPPTCSANLSCPGGYTCGQKSFDPSKPNAFAYCQCNTSAACPTGDFCNAAGGCQPPLHADVILSMHMDQSIPATIVQPPSSPDGQTLHTAYSYLDLGSDGAIYIGQVQGSSPTFTFDRQPELSGDAFVFLDMASDNGAYPLSLFYRRQADLSGGVDIGPMQPFTRIVSPAPGGALTGDRIQWSYDGGILPDVVILDVTEPGFAPKPIWEVILPGSETQVSVPPEVLTQMKAASSLQVSVTTALSPRFDFNHFSYGQLGLGAWTSFTLDNTQFVVP